MIYTLRVISILFVAMAMIPAGAHLFSMGSKLQLGGADYLVSQRAYDGWDMFAFVIVGTLISTLSLTVASYHAGEPFTLPGVSFLCLVAAQTLFWTLTFPANRATADWVALPDGWEMLRRQWEYSHAASAVLNALALLLLVLTSTRH